MTQLEAAKLGIFTSEMKQVAEIEQIDVQKILDGVASGRIVIPANINHKSLVPCGIGRILKTKINANIGNSTLSSCPGEEYRKMEIAIKYGADTVMDLSTGENIGLIRKNLALNFFIERILGFLYPVPCKMSAIISVAFSSSKLCFAVIPCVAEFSLQR